MAETKSPGIALVLSFLIAGLGQLYNGEFAKGIIFIVLSFVFFVLMIFLIGIPLYIALWIYSMYDAYKGAERFNAAHQTRLCLRCGAQIPLGAPVCPMCGTPIPGMPQPSYAPAGYPAPAAPPPGYGQPAPAAQPPIYAAQPAAGTAQVFCPTCGQRFPQEQGKFCPKDATELKPVV